MVTGILALTTGLFALLTLKWKIAALTASCWIEKNQCKEPTEEEMKECTGFVVENLLKRPADLLK